MGCNNGKASPPGALANKPDKEQEAKTLLGNADSSEPIKVSTENTSMRTSSMVAEPSSLEKVEPSQIQEAKQVDANAGEQKGPSGAGEESPAKGTPEKAPRVDSHSASHFSPLSIVGVWYYDGREHVWTGRRSKYEISIQGTELQIEQVVDNELHRGILVADGEYLTGTVKNLHGKETGQIRLQHKSGKLMSNFKVPGGSWGVDLTATKAVTTHHSHTPSTSSGKGSSEKASPEKELSPEAKDEEWKRLEEKFKTLQRIAENAAPEKNGPPPGFPAITQQDVGRAGEAAAAHAKSAGKPPSEVQPALSSGRKQKDGMCCC